MSFISISFLLFLPLTFAVYWLLGKCLRWQNLLIVLASYIFYGWWDWRFLLLIFLTSVSSYWSGLYIGRSSKPHLRKWIATANIVFNLLILGFFKYYNFFVDSLQDMLSVIGWQLDLPTLHLILPVGISFYTFQSLSYTIDVYRQKKESTKDVIGFFAYISFFPQLVAGPIERATNLLPQMTSLRRFDYDQAVDGMRQMLWGFLKKVVVADNCALIVNTYWNEYTDLPVVTLFLLAVLFSFQIYCDFSGYSDIAIGCARLFGIRLMRNFNNPYFSRSIPEFWRRWHISLMTWFRDYVYFPLGGSRCSKAKTLRNVYIVWAISGLWHAANWTYVCWGLFHATLLAIYNVFGINTKYEHDVAYKSIFPSMRELGQILLTFFLVVLSRVFSRSETLSQAFGYFKAMVVNPFFDVTTLYGMKSLIFALCLLTIEWLQRDKQHALQFSDRKLFQKRYVRWGVYYLIVMIIICFAGTQQTFIYFQF